MNTKAFSKTVLDTFAENLSAVKSAYVDSMRANELARKGVAKLTRAMSKVERNLDRSEKDSVRVGSKTLNNKSFKQFVVDALESSEMSIDNLVSRARGVGMVSTNQLGLRSSVDRAVRALLKAKVLKRTGEATYKLR